MTSDSMIQDGLSGEDAQMEAAVTPFAYLVAVHRLLDGGLVDLPLPAQRLYLQMVRETHGRGASQVTIGFMQLRRLTGMPNSTLVRALRLLQARELISLLDPGGPGTAATYQVELRQVGPV